VNTLLAPALKGAPAPAALTNVSVDESGRVYVGDGGQRAVYYYPADSNPTTVPHVIVQGLSAVGAVYVAPNGQNVLINGCFLASAQLYTRQSSGTYVPSRCFFLASFLASAAVDDFGVTLTPTDPENSSVIIAAPQGMSGFSIPHASTASISSVGMNASGSIAYAADARNSLVYAFARNNGSWLNGGSPQYLGTYTGFGRLMIIAVPE
jgi:hypothetical protein